MGPYSISNLSDGSLCRYCESEHQQCITERIKNQCYKALMFSLYWVELSLVLVMLLVKKILRLDVTVVYIYSS